MMLDELIGKLELIRKTEGGDIECCTYDSVLEDYTNNLCLEMVEDDYFLDEKEGIVLNKRMLLF